MAMKDTLITSCVLALGVAGLGGLSTGCLVDRGPLTGGEVREDAGEGEADVTERPDAYVEPGLDADLDAFEPDAYSDDAYSDDAFSPDAYSVDAYAPDACVVRCDGSTLVTCEGSSVERRDECKLGCGESPTPHCLQMVTSNLGSASIFDTATSDLSVTESMTIDTATMGARRTQRDGSEVAVLVYGGVSIGGTLRIVGPVPLVLIARDGITIGGTIDVSATDANPGPGGRRGGESPGASAAGPGNGRGGAHENTFEDGGGGGGGQCGTGGRGGDGDPDIGTTARGGDGGGRTDFVGDPETLRGGGGGGAGHGDGGRYGAGGAGGGAVQLSSRGTITIGGSVLARGSQGRPGTGGSGNDGAGGGGGAGGWILVEAPSVIIGGTLDASGANGGSGESGGGGGSGGITSSDGTPGGNDGGGGANGGGGGGGAGCLVIRSYDPLPVMGTFRPSDGGLQRLPLLLQ